MMVGWFRQSLKFYKANFRLISVFSWILQLLSAFFLLEHAKFEVASVYLLKFPVAYDIHLPTQFLLIGFFSFEKVSIRF